MSLFSFRQYTITHFKCLFIQFAKLLLQKKKFLKQELKYFLLQNGCRSVFLEFENEENIEKELSADSIQLVKEIVMKFIDSKFALYRWDEVESVCVAASYIFPCIQIVSWPSFCIVIQKQICGNSNFFHIQDDLCNYKAKKGTIYHKIHHKTYRAPSKKNKKKAQNSFNPNTTDENGNLIDQSNDIDEMEFLLFFKTCLVDRDIDILKIRLSQSVELRESLIKKNETKFHKVFPFYFIKPTLVRCI